MSRLKHTSPMPESPPDAVDLAPLSRSAEIAMRIGTPRSSQRLQWRKSVRIVFYLPVQGRIRPGAYIGRRVSIIPVLADSCNRLIKLHIQEIAPPTRTVSVTWFQLQLTDLSPERGASSKLNGYRSSILTRPAVQSALLGRAPPPPAPMALRMTARCHQISTRDRGTLSRALHCDRTKGRRAPVRAEFVD